jgi:hypothetical protein
MGALDSCGAVQNRRSFMGLPAVVREGAVGFRHAVRVFALLDGVAAVVGGVQQLARQTLAMVFRCGARGRSASGWRAPAALGANFDRNLIGGAADAARADFDRRRDVVRAHRGSFDRGSGFFFLARRFRARHRRSLGDGLLAVVHDEFMNLVRRDPRTSDRAGLRAFRRGDDGTFYLSLLTSDASRRTSNGAACGP